MAAQSRIQDIDVARESATLARNLILQKTTLALLETGARGSRIGAVTIGTLGAKRDPRSLTTQPSCPTRLDQAGGTDRRAVTGRAS